MILQQEKLSVLVIDAASQVNDPKLGLPNPSSQCSTCGSKDLKSCEGVWTEILYEIMSVSDLLLLQIVLIFYYQLIGHFGVIKFPFTILHPYYLSEVVKILNKVCPGCKSIRKETKVRCCRPCAGLSFKLIFTIFFSIHFSPCDKLHVIVILTQL